MYRKCLAQFSFLVLLATAGFLPADEPQKLFILAPDLPGKSEEGGVGRDSEIVAAVLHSCGYNIRFVVQPFGRHLWSYRHLDRVDGVMTAPLELQLSGFDTAAYIWYQNGALYSATRTAPIDNITDLYGLDVVTFQDGVRILDLEAEEKNFGSLYMSANQTLHSQLLMMGRVDAILADGMIVAEINRRVREKSNSRSVLTNENDEYRFAPIFNPTPYKMVFKSKEIAERFDQCFDRLYKDGTITAINDRHMERYRDELHYRYLGQ